MFDNEEATSRSIVGGPWMLDPNMKSTLYVRNNIETKSMSATPVLYLSNGKRLVLPDISLAAAATVTVSIGDALLAQGIAPYANLRGYIELQYTSSYDPLCATIVSVDTVHSVIFTYGFRPTAPVPMTQKATGNKPFAPKSGSQRIEGLWWKHSATVSGFVSLSNTAGESIDTKLNVTGSTGEALGTYRVTISSHATQTIDLAEFRSSQSVSGGVQLSYTGIPDSILISGGMEDSTSGYSATMAFRPFAPVPDGTKTTTLTELGLMTGAPDPMMLFPAGTEFTPFSVIRNVSPIAVSLIPESVLDG
jgi:hypothetical protein